jgi:hypothetical protein
MFDSVTTREARPLALMRKAVLALLALCLVTALSSGYRAYHQVYHLGIHLSESTIRNGSAIQVEVAGSGRTTVDVRVELIQGDHSETLAVQQVRGNEWASLDPRAREASQRVVLTVEQLARFRPGPATVRATATGRPQWLRLPPPTVREEAVEIQRE